MMMAALSRKAELTLGIRRRDGLGRDFCEIREPTGETLQEGRPEKVLKASFDSATGK